jgi:hypothetical protein
MGCLLETVGKATAAEHSKRLAPTAAPAIDEEPLTTLTNKIWAKSHIVPYVTMREA